MSIEANPSELSLLRGKVYFNRFDASGNPTGMRFLGDVSKLELTAAVTIKTAYEHTRAAANKIASIPTQQTHTLSIDMMEGFQPENAAMALLGDTAALTATSPTTVVAESMTSSVTPGRFYKTQYRNVSGLTLTAGSTALVLNTDYIITNAATGMIYIQPTSAATGALSANYTSGTLNVMRIRAGTTATIRGTLYFEGDPANGPVMDATFWIVQITPSAAISFITDDFATFSLSGEVLADAVNHPDSPLYDLVRTGTVAGSV